MKRLGGSGGLAAKKDRRERQPMNRDARHDIEDTVWQVLRRSPRRCDVYLHRKVCADAMAAKVCKKERISVFRAASRRLESSRRLITFVVACCISLPWLQQPSSSSRVSNGIYRKQDRTSRTTVAAAVPTTVNP